MSSELVVISPKTLSEAKELSTTLSGAQTLPEALRKSPADVLAIIMTGAELGLAPMMALRAVVLIKGKPTLSADAMGALVKRRRDVCEYLTCTETTDKAAAFETKRAGDPQPTRLSFTIEQAQRAQLAGGDNWRKYPEAMLRARALSGICRLVYPDLLMGVYDPEELSDEPAPRRQRAERQAQVVDVTPSPAPTGSISAPVQASAREVRAPGRVVEVAAGESEAAATERRARALRVWKAGQARGLDKGAFGAWVETVLGALKSSATWTDEDLARLESAQAQPVDDVPPSDEPPPDVVLPTP